MVRFEKDTNTDAKFFSVKTAVTVNNVQYRPSICYRIPYEVSGTIEELAKRGDAVLYAEEVRFLNGEVHSTSTEGISPADVVVAAVVSEEESGSKENEEERL